MGEVDMINRRHATRWTTTVLLTMALSGCSGGEESDDDAKPAATRPAAPSTAPAGAGERVDYTDLSIGTLAAGPGKPSSDADAWPQFRGANRDGIVEAPSAKGLYRSWPQGKLKVLWTIGGLAEGYAGAAIHSGRVFFHDYDKAAQRWMIRCVSLADGREIWRWSYPRTIMFNHGHTRTVPAVDAQVVVSLDPKLTLHAFDAATGRRLWARDLPRQYRAVIPKWYNGQCPLLDADRVIIGVAGPEVLMAAFDKRTGEVIWETPNPHGHAETHASVMPFVVGDEKQYAWCTLKGILGVRASDGALRWEALGPRWAAVAVETNKAAAPAGQPAASTVIAVPWQPSTAVAASPLDAGDGRLFMTTGYNVGSIMLQVRPGDPPGIEVLYRLTGDTKDPGRTAFESDCHTPVLWRDHLYSADHAYDESGPFVCLRLDGAIAWRSTRTPVSLGNWILADGLIFLLDGKDGVLRLLSADPAGYKELGRVDGLLGHEAWAPMAYANGKLVMRDQEKMVCVEAGTAEGK